MYKIKNKPINRINYLSLLNCNNKIAQLNTHQPICYFQCSLVVTWLTFFVFPSPYPNWSHDQFNLNFKHNSLHASRKNVEGDLKHNKSNPPFFKKKKKPSLTRSVLAQGHYKIHNTSMLEYSWKACVKSEVLWDFVLISMGEEWTLNYD